MLCAHIQCLETLAMVPLRSMFGGYWSGFFFPANAVRKSALIIEILSFRNCGAPVSRRSGHELVGHGGDTPQVSVYICTFVWCRFDRQQSSLFCIRKMGSPQAPCLLVDYTRLISLMFL